MTDIEQLANLSADLAIKVRILEADIVDLAWSWEQTIREAKFADPRLALFVLMALSRSYLRGRNLRMGNSQGRLRHEWKQMVLILFLVNHAAEKTSFESLHRAGVTSMESFVSLLKDHSDILDEANRILKEKTNERR